MRQRGETKKRRQENETDGREKKGGGFGDITSCELRRPVVGVIWFGWKLCVWVLQ